MKNILLFILFCLIVIPSHAEKIALIIAIGTYPENSGWHTISSENDIHYIKGALIRQGFNPKNITIIKNEQCTEKGIDIAITDLLDRSDKGDVVFVHYSGHGQQIIDDDGDEIDGLDEAIVPYDSNHSFDSDGYKGEKLIRDDNIEQYAFKLRKKIGKKGQLIWLFDSCHSGTATRGREKGKTRGTDVIMKPPLMKDKIEYKIGTNKEKYFLENIDSTFKLAPMLAYFGSGSNELNNEMLDAKGKWVGSLTFAFSKALFRINGQITGRKLFHQIKYLVKNQHPNQHPQFQASEEVIIFGNGVSQESLTIIDMLDENQLIGSFGVLQDIYVNSVVEIINQTTKQKVTEGKIIESNLDRSIILIDDPIDSAKISFLEARIISVAPPPVKYMIYAPISLESHWYPLVKEIAIDNKYILQDNIGHLNISIANDKKLTIYSKNGAILSTFPFDESILLSTIKEIKLFLDEYIRTLYLKSLQIRNEDYNVVFEFIPVSDTDSKKVYSLNEKDEMVIKEGVVLKIKVRNKGLKPAYYTILDFSPNGVLSIIAPHPSDYRYIPEDFLIQPNESQIIPYPLEISKPYGLEQMKLIATDEPIEFRTMLTNKKNIRGGEKFEGSFNSTFFNQEKRNENTKLSKINTNDLYFYIVQVANDNK